MENTFNNDDISPLIFSIIFHHVGMSWIISSNKDMKYDMDKTNHLDCLNKVPLYNTSICFKLHGGTFEYFITQAGTIRYNIMCSLISHDKMTPYYEYDESRLGYGSIPNDATPKSLEALGATINFIGIWLKLFLGNYNAICDAYINSMTEMFKQIPLTINKALTPK